MNEKVTMKWTKDMSFYADVNGHKITIDATNEAGGNDRGPRPKPMILLALGGCTGIDVVSILKKMRVKLDDFNVDIEASTTNEHPKYYDHFIITYTFKGKNLPMAKLEKAVNLSQERYCGVSEMLRKSSTLDHKIIVVEE
ncbi:MAG: osmotically inducible protein C [Bacteroidetes bacterium 4572_77]|nr:MAG: osmotically inducible protein C [Bacteroidetes bacterium 4572_77]